MKDLGLPQQILSMQIHCDRKAIKWWLSQKIYIYIKHVLDRFNIKIANLVSTPLANHFKLNRKSYPSIQEEKEYMTFVPYSSAIGSLMYAIICYRLDISHVVGIVNKFLSNTGKDN